MLKKFLAVSFLALCITSPAMGIELPKDASPTFYKPPTAYSSGYFNKILEAYELKLDTGKSGQLPSSFAKSADNKATYNKNPIAYSPKQYHALLTAYGLQLTAADAKAKLKASSYAKISGDKIVFGNGAIAYGGPEWNNIMSAYSLPAMDKPMAATPGDADGDTITDDKDKCPNTPAGAVVDERGCWAFGNALLFDFDSSVVKKELSAILDRIKGVFNSHPNLKVKVEGHADSTGPEAYNQKLSERRANAVVQGLVDRGVQNEKLMAVGQGELKPAYPNNTEANRAKNRRVEFTPVK
jgi:outer membrane protein OmpA-like peptidoglycan-associated protein